MYSPLPIQAIRKEQRRVAALLQQDRKVDYSPQQTHRSNWSKWTNSQSDSHRSNHDIRHGHTKFSSMKVKHGYRDHAGPAMEPPYVWNYKTKTEVEMRKHFSTPENPRHIVDRLVKEIQAETKRKNYGGIVRTSDIDNFDYNIFPKSARSDLAESSLLTLPPIDEADQLSQSWSPDMNTRGGRGGKKKKGKRGQNVKHKGGKHEELHVSLPDENGEGSSFRLPPIDGSGGALHGSGTNKYNRDDSLFFVKSYDSDHHFCTCEQPLIARRNTGVPGQDCTECRLSAGRHEDWCTISKLRSKSFEGKCSECGLVSLHDPGCSLYRPGSQEHICQRCGGIVRPLGSGLSSGFHESGRSGTDYSYRRHGTQTSDYFGTGVHDGDWTGTSMHGRGGRGGGKHDSKNSLDRVDKLLHSGALDYETDLDVNNVDTSLKFAAAGEGVNGDGSDVGIIGNSVLAQGGFNSGSTMFADHGGARAAYIKALAAAQINKMKVDPNFLEDRLSRSYVTSYFEPSPRLCPCGDAIGNKKKSVPKRGKEMNHIFGKENYDDYYPGGPKNPFLKTIPQTQKPQKLAPMKDEGLMSSEAPQLLSLKDDLFFERRPSSLKLTTKSTKKGSKKKSQGLSQGASYLGSEKAVE